MVQWIRIGDDEVNTTAVVPSDNKGLSYCYLGNINNPNFVNTIIDLVRRGYDLQVNSVHDAGITK